MFIFILTVLLGLLGGVYLYLTWYHDYWKQRGVVTAKPLTLLGSYPGLFLTSGNRNFIDDVQRIYDKYKGKHRAVGAFITRVPQLLVLDPQLAHQVLVTNFSDFRDTISSNFVGHVKADQYVMRNPFFSKGDAWKKRRADGGGGLTQIKLKQAYGIWEQNGCKLLKYMDRLIQQRGNVLETRDLCYRYGAAVVGDFIWGIDAGSLADDPNAPPSQLQQVSSAWAAAAFSKFTKFTKFLIAPWLPKLLQVRFFSQEMDEFYLRLTQDAVKLRMSFGNAEQHNYLAHMLQLMEHRGATLDDLVGHALTLLMDGYETSMGMLYHMLYTLGHYPEAQQKLRAELLDAFDANQNISYEELIALPFLDQCVNESLRLSSLIGTLSKVCTKATTIDLNDGKQLQLEPGTNIMLPAYHYHHDETYYPEPEEFKPERFENNAHIEFTKNGYFLPFGDGPRICLGMRMGLLNVKMAIARIISQYQVESPKMSYSCETIFGKFLVGDINLKYTKVV